MGTIEDIYADLDAEVTEEEFRDAVAAKVEQMGGLADEETAAMLIAHELGEGGIEGIADIETDMDEVKFLAKVLSVGELRTFERDEGEGHVLNIEVADETGRVRVALWDEAATNAVEELSPGDILRIKGRPKEGYSGLEISASRVEGDQDATIDVDIGEEGTIAGLALGQSDVTVRGRVLGTEPVRTFSRNDGSEGKVANLVLGDETGKVRVTMWDEKADLADEFADGVSVEVRDGYVRERDDALELHVGNRGSVVELDDTVEYVPETTDIADLELGMTVDLSGVVRSADPKRTFERNDGSEGQVKNIRVQDRTGDIRVALWGDHADADLGPGDEVLVADVEVKDGWKDDLEASAGWRSTVTVLDSDGSSGTADGAAENGAAPGTLSSFSSDDGGSESAATTDTDDDGPADGEQREVTGTVVQPGDPIVVDTGTETVTVSGTFDVHLGQEVTVRGVQRDGALDAEELF